MANQMGESSEGSPSGTGKPLNAIKHTQSRAVKSWIGNELKQQQKRFKKILKNMEDLSPKREKWSAEFFDRITTRGTNIDGDIRRVVAPEELPKPPRRKFRVTYKPGDLKGIDH